MISIQLLKKENTDEALLFLQPYESECVNLASEILRGSTDCWCVIYNDEASQTKTLAGLFALRKKRSLFFCLPFAKYKSAFDKKVCSEAQRPLMEFFESREPFCVNGEAAGAVFLRNILKNKKSPMRPSVTNKYFLMVSGEENESCPQALERRISRNVRARDQARANSGIEALDQYSGEALQDLNSGGGSGANCGLRVVQATAADYERLLPLELGYQREEVVPDSFDISDAALGAAFKHELGQGLTFALYDGDRPIAKARVSARGLRHCMLGGVYTLPSERKKGRAAFLVRQIIALFESGLDGQRQNAGGQNCSQGLNAGGGSIDSGKPCFFGTASDSGKPDDSRPSLAFDSFCLYAKQENAAALALYKSLGFTPRGEYLLVYY